MLQPLDFLTWMIFGPMPPQRAVAAVDERHHRDGWSREAPGEEPPQAREHHRKFVQLWKDCDPELRPMVEAARAKSR